jgi:ADP-heptose:LPS heptosyltransferase
MYELIKRNFPGIEVVLRAPDYPGGLGTRPFDYHLPVGCLQDRFATTVETVPWRGPYIRADKALAECYDLVLDKLHLDGLKIGLCWSSGIREDELWLRQYGKHKSTTLETLSPLLTVPDCFVSLQVGPERDELTPAYGSWPVFDLLPKEPSWSETAALVANLDLVITVDTALAHLAGAMGKRVWLLMHTQGSWHWMVERPGASWNERSPWYPSVRIFRQEKQDVWSDVVERIVEELRSERAIAAE